MPMQSKVTALIRPTFLTLPPTPQFAAQLIFQRRFGSQPFSGQAKSFRGDLFAGLYEPAHRLQTQLLGFLHADVQSPACLTLQAHLVLESNSSFRLILCWKRVSVEFPPISRYPDYADEFVRQALSCAHRLAER